MALVGKVEPGGDICQRISLSDRLAGAVEPAHDAIPVRRQTMLLRKGPTEMFARNPRVTRQHSYGELIILSRRPVRAGKR